MKLTPMKVRGKRKAPPEVKWNYGKKRKVLPKRSEITLDRDSNTRSDPSTESTSRRRRKKRAPELSRLEQLPTEILHTIFEYSANLDLPLTSPRLASQLASRHLYHSLTSIILQPSTDKRILWSEKRFVWNEDGSEAKRSAAQRLMNSRFFTWPFLRSWLHEHFEAHISHVDVDVNSVEACVWALLGCPSLPPPTKLLRGPFNREKIRFLGVLTRDLNIDADDLDPAYIERARDGLQQAVPEGATGALLSFWILGMRPDTELLRVAVIDSGCDKELVRSLVNRVYSLNAMGAVDINFLDPALWSWIEKAKANGNEKGSWLKDLLKHAARESSRKAAEVKKTESISSDE